MVGYSALWDERVRARSRDPSHLAPVLERLPQAAVETEAIERRRGGDRPDSGEDDAGPLEAAFLQHAARRRVAHPRAGGQPIELQVVEGVVDERARGLGGVAA